MRRGVLLIIAGLSLAAATAGGATAAAHPTLPALFAKQIASINAAPKAPPVLLPRTMALDAVHEYASGGPSGRRYDLEIGAVKHCGGADACFVADFSAEPATTVFGQRVTVPGASKAGFDPLSCGASCSPPQIDFLVHGIRYVIQANLRGKNNRAALIAAARSAIAAGPRTS